jgi:hypothetical protein
MVLMLSRMLVIAMAFVAEAGATSIIEPSPSSVPLTAGWQSRDCGSFHVLAPEETVLHRRGRFAGVLVDRRFSLSYAVGAAAADIGKDGLDYKEVPVEVGGRRGVLRTAEFPGTDAPYFLQLVVPDAVKVGKGPPMALEMHGWFANRERRWLGEHVVTSAGFAPVFDIPIAPVRPRVLPPVIEIDRGSGENAP